MRKLLAFILRLLARAVLAKYRPITFGVTGSVGKTSSKEAIYTVLSSYAPGEARRNEKNMNTEIGLPLAVLGLPEANRSAIRWMQNIARGVALVLLPLRYPRYLVLELGADRPGDIQYFVRFVRLDVAVVTAVGEMPVHLEHFPSRDAYVLEKAAILSGLKPGGLAVLNADDSTVRRFASRLQPGVKVLTYGIQNADADVRAETKFYETAREELKNFGVSFKVNYRGTVVPFRLNHALGEGAIYAALVAAAVGVSCGMNLLAVSEALLTFRPPRGRLNFIAGIENTLIIDDSYNSSPLAVRVALSTLGFFAGRRKVVVFGDMLELGGNSERAHRELAKELAESADVIMLVGQAVRVTFEELVKRGWQEGRNVFLFPAEKESRSTVKELLRKGDVVLVKGSQGIRLERVIEGIMKEPQRAGELLVRQEEKWLNKP